MESHADFLQRPGLAIIQTITHADDAVLPGGERAEDGVHVSVHAGLYDVELHVVCCRVFHHFAHGGCLGFTLSALRQGLIQRPGGSGSLQMTAPSAILVRIVIIAITTDITVLSRHAGLPETRPDVRDPACKCRVSVELLDPQRSHSLDSTCSRA